jgi:hypothetical protein
VSFSPQVLALGIAEQSEDIVVMEDRQLVARPLLAQGQLGEPRWRQEWSARKDARPWILLPVGDEAVLLPGAAGYASCRFDRGTLQSTGALPGFAEYGSLFPEAVWAGQGWTFALPAFSVFWQPGAEPLLLPPPALRAMEQASRLPGPGQDWLIFGGEPGRFDSFGWQLGPGKAGANPGIVLRWGMDGPDRLLLFTTTNRLSGQLKQSLMGKLKVEIHVFLRKKGAWQAMPAWELDIPRKKPPAPFQASWLWEWDANGDGWGDLLLSHSTQDALLFLSSADGSLAREPRRLVRSHQRLLSTRDRLWAVDVENGGLRLQTLAP